MKKVNDLFFMRPWALKEDTLTALSEIIDRHIKGESLSSEAIEALKKKDEKTGAEYEVSGGVAFIPVYGVISKRASLIHDISQGTGTSTEAIKKNLKAALADKSVTAIALDIDSPGGSVDGVPELSDFIFESRKKKKIYAFADGQMDSAAYWIGSAAEKLFATKSSEVGSIGVYSVVNDYSVFQHNRGVKTEVIKAGKHKAAGHPAKPLTEDDRAVIQEEVNTYYEMFVSAVSRNRGISSEEATKLATGKVFIGEKALEIGLIDEMGSIESFFSGDTGGGSAKAAGSTAAREVINQEAGTTGATETITIQPKELTMDLKTLTAEELKMARPDLCVALVNEGKAAGLKEGREAAEAEANTAKAAEKARVSEILKKAKSIQGVEDAALAAIEGGDSVEAAGNKLKASKLDKLQAAAPAALGAGNVTEAPAVVDETIPAKAERLWAAGGKIREEFSSKETFAAFLKAESEGRVKIYKAGEAKK